MVVQILQLAHQAKRKPLHRIDPVRVLSCLSWTTGFSKMIQLDKALQAWGTPDFEAVLKQEVAQLGISQLPLQQGLTVGNYVLDEPLTVTINSVVELEDLIRVQAGIFFKSVIGGCSCAGDPTQDSEINEYCEVLLQIKKSTAATTVDLVKDQAR